MNLKIMKNIKNIKDIDKAIQNKEMIIKELQNRYTRGLELFETLEKDIEFYSSKRDFTFLIYLK